MLVTVAILFFGSTGICVVFVLRKFKVFLLINYLENVTVLTISKNRSRGLRLKLQFLQVCTFK